MRLGCTILTEQEITNKITFSAVRALHGITFPGRTRRTGVSSFRSLENFARSNSIIIRYSFSNFYSLYCLSRYKLNFNQNTVFFIERNVYKHSSDVIMRIRSFLLPRKKCKVS